MIKLQPHRVDQILQAQLFFSLTTPVPVHFLKNFLFHLVQLLFYLTKAEV